MNSTCPTARMLPAADRDSWKWLPNMPAGEFTEALKQQQRTDLARSIQFARKQLGPGLRSKNA
ncbi:MAG: hypothetical protein ABJC09_04340 [Terriglobia bacterium]